MKFPWSRQKFGIVVGKHRQSTGLSDAYPGQLPPDASPAGGRSLAQWSESTDKTLVPLTSTQLLPDASPKRWKVSSHVFVSPPPVLEIPMAFWDPDSAGPALTV